MAVVRTPEGYVEIGAVGNGTPVQPFNRRIVTAPGDGQVLFATAFTLDEDETGVNLRGVVSGVSQTDGNDVLRGTFEGTWTRAGGIVIASVTTVFSQGAAGATTDIPIWSFATGISGDDITLLVEGSSIAGTNTSVVWVGNWTAQKVI